MLFIENSQKSDFENNVASKQMVCMRVREKQRCFFFCFFFLLLFFFTCLLFCKDLEMLPPKVLKRAKFYTYVITNFVLEFFIFDWCVFSSKMQARAPLKLVQ